MSKETKVHAALPFKADPTGALLINGRSALDIAAAYDRPVFAYDRSIMDAAVSRLRAALPSSISLHYAIKANPFAPVVRHLAGQVDGLDVASEAELRLARAIAGPDMPVSFAGPGKRDAELSSAIEFECTVNVESERELARLARIAREKGRRARAAVRVNPPFDLRGSGMRMGGGAKPFGMDDDRVPALLAHWPTEYVDFRGFHIFTGSQSLSAHALGEAHGQALALGLALAKHAPVRPVSINIGGGLGVPYFPGDTSVDVEAVGAQLNTHLTRHAAEIGDTTVILELGRYLVAESGTYLATVVDKKTSRGTVFLVTDGGMHHQLAVSGNFGQAFRKNYPVAIAGHYDPQSSATEVVNIVGCLCTPLDRLGDQMELPVADVGDIVAVFRCGAYGPSASPAAFLSHPPSAEILI